MMKTIKVLYSLMVLMLVSNCHNEPYEGGFPADPDPCLMAIQATAEAETNFLLATDDSYSLLCQIYRDALDNQIEICGDDDDSLQILLYNLGNCADDDLCAEAIAATEIAQSEYENATEQNFEGLCNNYKNALNNQIIFCGDEDSILVSMIEQLGSCVVEDIVPIEGEWVLNFILVSSQLDIDNDEESTLNIYSEIACHEVETVNFFEDGTGEYYYSTVADFSYVQNSASNDGVDYIVSCIEVDSVKAFVWDREGANVTTIFNNGETFSFIKGPNVLALIIPDGFVAYNTNGLPEHITQDISYVFYKE